MTDSYSRVVATLAVEFKTHCPNRECVDGMLAYRTIERFDAESRVALVEPVEVVQIDTFFAVCGDCGTVAVCRCHPPFVWRRWQNAGVNVEQMIADRGSHGWTALVGTYKPERGLTYLSIPSKPWHPRSPGLPPWFTDGNRKNPYIPISRQDVCRSTGVTGAQEVTKRQPTRYGARWCAQRPFTSKNRKKEEQSGEREG